MTSRAIVGSACGDPLALDAAWMTEALESGGVAGGATVTDVEFDGFIGTGQMSRNARYRLAWDRPDGRPATVVGKFPSADENTKQSSFDSGAYHHEYAFYAQLAATVAIRTPRCWVARFDAAAPDFVLILEDLADSAQGDQFSEPSDDVTNQAIEQAAALHGPRWGDPTLADEPAMQSPFGDRGELLRHYFNPAHRRLGPGHRDTDDARARRLPARQLPDRHDPRRRAVRRGRLADAVTGARRRRRRGTSSAAPSSRNVGATSSATCSSATGISSAGTATATALTSAGATSCGARCTA